MTVSTKSIFVYTHHTYIPPHTFTLCDSNRHLRHILCFEVASKTIYIMEVVSKIIQGKIISEKLFLNTLFHYQFSINSKITLFNIL
jgi:hypothetical protein